MKKKTNKLEQAVDAIVKRLEKTEKFVVDQAPDICKEILLEKRVSNIYYLIVSFAAFLGFLGGSYFIENLQARIVMVFVSGMSLIFTLCIISELISILTAPKLTILKELRKLYRGDE